MLTGTNSSFTRLLNRRVVIETIRRHQPTSRAEIAQRTKLTHAGVSNIVESLAEEGFVVARGRRSHRRGQPAVEYALNPEAAFAIGINLDRDQLVGVRLDLNGRAQKRITWKVDYPAPDEAMALFTDATDQLSDLPRTLHDRILGVGLALPTGKWIDPPDFLGWDHPAVKQDLSERLNQPIYVENDATAATIWERLYGAGQAHDDFFYIYFGCSIGAGIVSGGQPLYGTDGHAGEFGFTPIFPNAEALERGSTEPLMKHVSLSAFERHMAQASGADDASAPEPRQSAGPSAWLDHAARLLTAPLLGVDHLLDPEVMFLGGRLPQPLRADLANRLQAALATRRVPSKSKPLRVLPSQAGEDAAALGAATLLMYEALAPSPDLVRKHALAKGGQKDAHEAVRT